MYEEFCLLNRYSEVLQLSQIPKERPGGCGGEFGVAGAGSCNAVMQPHILVQPHNTMSYA